MKNKEEILEIAKEICQKENWEWVNPSVNFINNQWEVITNSSLRGGNAFIRIDEEGNIIEKFYNNR